MGFIQLHIENVKCISLQEMMITEGKVNLLKGGNGAGKTTVIDCLWLALLGSKHARKFQGYSISDVVKQDENTAIIRVTTKTSNNDFVVSRKIDATETGTHFRSIKIESSSKPIEAKDVVKLFSLRSIDIFTFLELQPKEQFDYLSSLLPSDEFQKLQEQLTNITEELSSLNIKKRNADDRIRNSIQTTPVAVVDVAKEQEERKQLQQQKDAVNLQHVERKRLEQLLADTERKGDAKRAEILVKTEEIKRIQDDVSNITTDIISLNQQISALPNKYADIDVPALDQRIKIIDDAIANNSELYAKKNEYDIYLSDLSHQKDIEEQTKDAYGRRDGVLQQQRNLFKQAGCDVDVSFTTDKGMCIDNTPIVDMSSGEQIREVVKVLQSTFSPEQVRLCIVRNANMLDSNTLDILNECSTKYNITFLCEWVDSNTDGLAVEVYEKE